MSLGSLLMKKSINVCIRNATPLLLVSRQGHRMRGKPPGVAKTLEQRLKDENQQDPELTERINIGFPRLKPSRSQQLKERLEQLKAHRGNNQLEKLAREGKLMIDLEQVHQDYSQTSQPFDLRVVADHYGIFNDLFGCAYFVPRVPLHIKYAIGDSGSYVPVYSGNILKPAESRNAPEALFDGFIDPITGKRTQGDMYWSLVATNPDGDIKNSEAECIHWFVSNIPNGDVSKGDVLVNYLPPFPPKGIGYQRFVFVLYKQNAKLDLSAHKVNESNGYSLEGRTFSTLDFYRQHQDEITPAGLAFYQVDWDESLTEFYHDTLKMKEPIYEYDFPEAYLADQKFFPLKQPFNLYMDKHRDIKQVNKEYLQRKLAKTHPFEGPEPPLRFPNAHPLRGMPSWLKTEMKKERLRIGRVNDY